MRCQKLDRPLLQFASLLLYQTFQRQLLLSRYDEISESNFDLIS